MCGNKCRAPLKSHHCVDTGFSVYESVCAHLPSSALLLRDPRQVTSLQLHVLYVLLGAPGFSMALHES